MKNEAMAVNGSDALPAAWREALTLLDRDLLRRGTAERTRAVYGRDADELAHWAVRYTLEPADVDYPWLRRYAAQLAERGLAPRTTARKLAALRALFRVLVEHGVTEANPADLLASPKLPQRLPRALKPADVAALLDRIPASTPLEIRDRALFELAYGCGLRAEELVDLDARLDRLRRGAGARRGQGRQDPLRARRGARAGGGAPLSGACATARWTRESGEPALFLSKSGRRLSTSDVRRRLRTWARSAAAQGAVHPARPQAFVRDSSSGGRCRSTCHPGVARPLVHLDDPGLHSGRVSTPAGSVRTKPPTGVTTEERRWKPTSKRSS